MVGSTDLLPQPVGVVTYFGTFGETVGHTIYVLDQEMNKVGIPYFARLRSYGREALFDVYVSWDRLDTVSSIVARLKRI